MLSVTNQNLTLDQLALMANGKRKAVDMDPGAKEDYVSPFIPHFESFRTELDEHHDRRERIIKASRDITALSKKM